MNPIPPSVHSRFKMVVTGGAGPARAMVQGNSVVNGPGVVVHRAMHVTASQKVLPGLADPGSRAGVRQRHARHSFPRQKTLLQERRSRRDHVFNELI